jgi:hypothetical protein
LEKILALDFVFDGFLRVIAGFFNSGWKEADLEVRLISHDSAEK